MMQIADFFSNTSKKFFLLSIDYKLTEVFLIKAPSLASAPTAVLAIVLFPFLWKD
jgi:hypothetical protein